MMERMRAFRSTTFHILFAVLIFAVPVSSLFAQVLHDEYRGTWRATVLAVVEERNEVIPGTDTERLIQTLRVEVLDGPKAGELLSMQNDYLELEEGDTFYFNYNVHIDGTETYGVVSVDRSVALIVLAILFVGAVVLFGGWQGVRALTALLGSFFAVFYILLPGILGGWNPILASVLVASGILFAAIFFTHGFNRESVVAYIGTMIAVLLTSILAFFSVSMSSLSGFASDASTYLNFNTRGTLDFTALLLGAIIIGVLGVLDDIAVTQSAVVTELYESNPKMSRREVYRRALRVGREHVGALVNTLVLAYAGASLPLLLHFYMVASDTRMALSSELFATEIVRTIVGSIGLIMTVPIVTLLAVVYLKGYRKINAHGHTHGHSH